MSVAILSAVVPNSSLAPTWAERFPATIRPDQVLQADAFNVDGVLNGRVVPWRKDGQPRVSWGSPSALLKTLSGYAYYDSTTAADQVFGYVDGSANGQAMASIEWGGGARVAGVTFRMGTISNYWDFILRSTGVALRKTVSGTSTNQATATFTPVVGASYRLLAEFNGTSITATVYADGMEPIRLTVDSPDLQSNIRSGLTMGILHKALDFSAA